MQYILNLLCMVILSPYLRKVSPPSCLPSSLISSGAFSCKMAGHNNRKGSEPW